MGNVLEKADFHEDMRCLDGEERKYPEEWHRGKTWHSEGTDNNQVERIFKRWRTQEERQYGIGGVGGWRDTGWREDRGLWLV